MAAKAACRSGRLALRRKLVSSCMLGPRNLPRGSGKGASATRSSAFTAARRVISFFSRSRSSCSTTTKERQLLQHASVPLAAAAAEQLLH